MKALTDDVTETLQELNHIALQEVGEIYIDIDHDDANAQPVEPLRILSEAEKVTEKFALFDAMNAPNEEEEP